MSDIANNIPYLSVIIPAYNEENRIKFTIEQIIKYLSTKNLNYEIIVVNDGSTDGTADVVADISLNKPNIKLLNNISNSGKGASVKKGMLTAKGKFRLFMDADNSTSIEHFEAMQTLLESSADVVIGSRRVEGAEIEIHQSWLRENMGRVFNLLVKLIVGLPYNDTQTGFKAFSANAADLIFAQQNISGWAFDIELLVIAKKLGLEIQEIPIKWKNSPNSHVKFSGMVKMLFDLIKISTKY